MITLLLLIPLIGCLAILPIQEGFENNNSRMKQIALITSVINFLIIL